MSEDRVGNHLCAAGRIHCVHVACTLCSAGKPTLGQVKVKNEFNRVHLGLIDIYRGLNQITIEICFAHEIIVLW